MGMGGQRHALTTLRPGKTRYPLYRRLGGPQGRSGRVRKISSLPGFDPRTVQPVASSYTDWAIPAPDIGGKALLILSKNFQNILDFTSFMDWRRFGKLSLWWSVSCT